jgi:hypothetical protein
MLNSLLSNTIHISAEAAGVLGSLYSDRHYVREFCCHLSHTGISIPLALQQSTSPYPATDTQSTHRAQKAEKANMDKQHHGDLLLSTKNKQKQLALQVTQKLLQ